MTSPAALQFSLICAELGGDVSLCPTLRLSNPLSSTRQQENIISAMFGQRSDKHKTEIHKDNVCRVVKCIFLWDERPCSAQGHSDGCESQTAIHWLSALSRLIVCCFSLQLVIGCGLLLLFIAGGPSRSSCCLAHTNTHTCHTHARTHARTNPLPEKCCFSKTEYLKAKFCPSDHSTSLS